MPVRAELHRHAHVEAVDPVLALEVRGAGQHALLVEQDRVDHLRRGGARRVPGRGAEQLHELAAALGGALDHRGDLAPRRRACGAARRRPSSPRRRRPSGRRGRRARPRATSLTDAPVSQAMNVCSRAVSRMPAWPKTRSFGKPETLFATWHIASSGFETTIRIASGLFATTFSVTSLTIFSFVVHEVVAAHARRAREAGGDHDDVGACGRRRSRSSR